jgi:hypothetical protein
LDAGSGDGGGLGKARNGELFWWGCDVMEITRACDG